MTTEHCQSNEQYPLIVKTDHYQLRFSTTGKLVSFLNARGDELVNASNPGKAFHLLLNMQTEIPLCELAWLDGNILKCLSANGTQSVQFQVIPRDRYCYFKLVRLEGIPTTSVLTLHFGVNVVGRVRAFDTDYMTVVLNPSGPDNAAIEHARDNALVTTSSLEDDVQVHFKYIWNRNAGNPLGGFALYAPADDEDEDDIILRIWANEGLPHPKVPGEWNYERARQWVANWQQQFAQRNQLMLEGTSLDELYEGAAWAEKAGCNEVYLFTNSWRNEGFWPMNELNWSLRPDIYPKGESDLRAYSDYLWQRGIRLNIHYVSGGFGKKDPGYVVRPHDQLAGYGAFALADPVSDSDTTIRVRPLNGVERPFLVDDSSAGLRMPAMHRFFNYSHIQIGQEIVAVGEFQDTDTGTWTLAECRRGVNGVVTAHGVDEPVKGLIAAYGINFLPDNDSHLLAEVAENFAGLVNRCHLSHTEYDGAEIHNYNGAWGYQKFTALVYSHLDHPVTAHDSGASQPKCCMEYRLNSSRKLLEGSCPYSHGNYSVPFVLDSNSRPAVNKLDTHYTLSQGYKGGALGLAKPEPMFGIRPGDLAAHGQIDELLEILRTWREVAANLTNQQRRLIEKSFRYLPERYERSKHLASKNVFVARKVGGRLSLVPTTVMTRAVGDPLWIHGQEHGAIPPKQYLKLNGELTLENPHARQVPRFVIRLAQNYDYNLPTKSVFDFEEAAGRAETLGHVFETGNEADQGAARPAIDCNMLLDPKPEDFSGQSLTSIKATGDGYVLTAENVVNSEYFEAYKLPAFNCRANMAHHRGIGMVIEGDGSGAIFAIQIAGRDYVVPIDFTGEQYIEILNGEVAWHEERWGWRMATKHTRYSMVTWFRTGFCRIPARTRAQVKVRDIKLLKELPVTLQELTISNSTGQLQIRGAIRTGDYIEYDGGDTAIISDANFNSRRTVNVENTHFMAGTGYDTYHFSGDQPAWIEVQLTTAGDEIVVK